MTMTQVFLVFPALALVLALAVLAGRAAQRFGLAPKTMGGRLEAVQAIALDGRRRVHLLRCDDRHVLLLTGGGNDVLLGWVEPAREVQS
jgi:flagellar protein FliO/FliZ